MRRVTICLLLAGIACGCSHSSSRPRTPPQGQSTPQELLAKYYRTARSGDTSDYIDCYLLPTEAHRRVVEAEIAMARSAYSLYDAIDAAYDANAVGVFRGATDPSDGANINCVLAPRDDPNWPQQAQIVTSGDSAVARVLLDNGERREVPMVHVGGAWFFDANAMAPDPEAITQFMVRLRKAVEKTRTMVGKPGVGPRELKLTMIKAFQDAKE